LSNEKPPSSSVLAVRGGTELSTTSAPPTPWPSPSTTWPSSRSGPSTSTSSDHRGAGPRGAGGASAGLAGTALVGAAAVLRAGSTAFGLFSPRPRIMSHPTTTAATASRPMTTLRFIALRMRTPARIASCGCDRSTASGATGSDCSIGATELPAGLAARGSRLLRRWYPPLFAALSEGRPLGGSDFLYASQQP
jgi:hypothetical protein